MPAPVKMPRVKYVGAQSGQETSGSARRRTAAPPRPCGPRRRQAEMAVVVEGDPLDPVVRPARPPPRRSPPRGEIGKGPGRRTRGQSAPPAPDAAAGQSGENVGPARPRGVGHIGGDLPAHPEIAGQAGEIAALQPAGRRVGGAGPVGITAQGRFSSGQGGADPFRHQVGTTTRHRERNNAVQSGCPPGPPAAHWPAISAGTARSACAYGPSRSRRARPGPVSSGVARGPLPSLVDRRDRKSSASSRLRPRGRAANHREFRGWEPVGERQPSPGVYQRPAPPSVVRGSARSAHRATT